MELNKILIASPFNEDLLKKLQSIYDISYIPSATKNDIKNHIPRCNAVVIATKPGLDRAVLQYADRLKLIIRLGIGVDHIDLNYCHENNISVAITPFSNISPVTELVFSQLIRVTRRLPECENNIYKGNFRNNLAIGNEINGKTIGVIGTGRIGSRICRIASSFGLKVLAYDPYINNGVKNSLPAVFCPTMDHLIEESDIITLHVPHTIETDNLVNKDFLDKMKPNSIFINTSRGKVAPIKNLLEYSYNKKIKHFIIDVYEEEPFTPEEKHIKQYNDFFTLTPHIGAYTEESLYNRSKECIDELDEFFNRKIQPHGMIDLTKGY